MIQRNDKLLIFILAVGVFGILNTEMGVVGIIPQVSERFGVSVPDAGLLVSGFALIVAVAGPTMPLLFSKMNRKHVMLLALGVFSTCNVAAVCAPSFEVLLACRVLPAAFHPLYVSMANLGTTLGTSLCGAFITVAGTRFAVFGALIFLAAGVLFVLWRLRSARRAASMPSESTAVDASADPAAALAASTAGNRPRHEGGTA